MAFTSIHSCTHPSTKDYTFCHFCGNLVTTKHDFSPIFSPLLPAKNREILNIQTYIEMKYNQM